MKNRNDSTAPDGCPRRLVRGFDSLLRWIAQKNAPLGPIEFMLALAVLIMSIAVTMGTAAILVRIINENSSTTPSHRQESIQQETRTEKGGQL